MMSSGHSGCVDQDNLLNKKRRGTPCNLGTATEVREGAEDTGRDAEETKDGEREQMWRLVVLILDSAARPHPPGPTCVLRHRVLQF